MKIKVWIKDHEDEAKILYVTRIEMERVLNRYVGERLTPVNVNDYLCSKSIFSWSDYTKIRYKRLKE